MGWVLAGFDLEFLPLRAPDLAVWTDDAQGGGGYTFSEATTETATQGTDISAFRLGAISWLPP
jgi:hypothetical protein